MPSDIAVCRVCGKSLVVLRVDDCGHFYWFCCVCWHITAARPEAKDADQDVNWLPAHEVRFS